MMISQTCMLLTEMIYVTTRMNGQGIPELALIMENKRRMTIINFYSSGTDIYERYHKCLGVQKIDNLL